MRLKTLLTCGALAACMALTGCNNNNNAIDPSEYEVKSVPPTEIEGFDGNVKDVAPKSGDLIAEIEIEGYGTIKAVLFPQAAPVGVENFQKLADAGYYKGLKIHRVLSDFMFQGGSKNGDGSGGKALVNDGSFGIETAQNARHFYGALCYANAAGENTTQFYIVNNKTPADYSELDKQSYIDSIEAIKELIQQALDDKNTMYAEYYRESAQEQQTILDWIGYAPDAVLKRYAQVGGTAGLDGNYTVFGQVYEGFDVIDSISAAEVVDNGSDEISKPVQDIVIKNITVSAFNG